ncbi:ethylene-insensitive protein 2 [Musa troglodytarum]|uniref:Ethylene-insensitive protein 2 n=1 Tax=Musa troglodytarum TaxID=320322 RepID=A0A9E7KFG4_9LILI|nr:ethylene-insensitive protein 2 [Musa troglodytarum]
MVAWQDEGQRNLPEKKKKRIKRKRLASGSSSSSSSSAACSPPLNLLLVKEKGGSGGVPSWCAESGLSEWSEKECDTCEKPLALDVPSAIVKATDLYLTHQRLCALVMYSDNFNMT